MSLDSFIHPWSGDTYRHIPATGHFGILDFRNAGIAANNRWNDPGEPTLYVASDRGVTIADFARHLARDRPRAITAGVLDRRLYRLRLKLEAVFDLCTSESWDALSLDGAPQIFLDRTIARATAQFIRATTSAQALRVPSMAFLDDLTRWSLVIFLEKLPGDTLQFISEVEPDDLFSIRDAL